MKFKHNNCLRFKCAACRLKYVTRISYLQEDIKTLYTYIVESFEKVLENVQYVQTFKLMKQRYYQLQERYRDKSPLER